MLYRAQLLSYGLVDINSPSKLDEITICMIKYQNIKLHINVTPVGREGEGGEECDINFQVTEEE